MNIFSKYFLLLFFCLMVYSGKTSAKVSPSFDCSKATTEVEKLICSDDELAKKMDAINKCDIYTPLNCKQINSQIDSLTCSDTGLLKLYEKMQKKYFELCKSLSSENERIRLYKNHVEWINRQESADYMEFGAYNRRIFYLSEAYQEKINSIENYINGR